MGNGPLSEAIYPQPSKRELMVLVVENAPVLSRTIGFLCDYLGIRVETVSGHASQEMLLRERRPMAVMSSMDNAAQDGCHILKIVAEHDRSLPVLLVTGNKREVLGAVEAAEQVWELDRVLKTSSTPGIGDVVEFLSRAGRRSGGSLMPV
jgi:DNA-binding NtrC family response regulator